MTLPRSRNVFSESKQTSRAALIDMAGMLFLSQFVSMQVFFLLPRQRDVRTTMQSCNRTMC